MTSDKEREREAFMEAMQGVSHDMLGQTWRWSNYGRGNIPLWHPMAVGRSKTKPRSFAQDLRNGAIFVAIVLGIPAILLYAPAVARLIAALLYSMVFVFWIVVAEAVARSRARRAEFRHEHFPHPGPKGHHQHR